jgi:hypothetical protein
VLADVAAPEYRQMGVACSKCDRRGRVSVAQLLAEYGPDMSLQHTRKYVAVGCPACNRFDL